MRSMLLSSASTNQSPAGWKLSEQVDALASKVSASFNLKRDARAELPQTFHGSIRPRRPHKPECLRGKVVDTVLVPVPPSCTTRATSGSATLRSDAHSLQGLPKQTLGSTEISFNSSLRSITPDSA